jgi:hypothetical protein
VPHMPKWVVRDASTHEEAAFGFWPGNVAGPMAEAAFYAYALPPPDGFSEASMRSAAARFPKEMGEWVLPYEAVRKSKDPDAEILGFLQDTYDAAANLGSWDRTALDRTEKLPPERVPSTETLPPE